MARAIQAGARGLVHKTVPIDDLAEAVRRAARGEPLHRPAEVNRVLQVERERSERDRDLERRVERLTPRETQILQAMADGMSSEQIAEQLGMSRHTLRTHTQNILTRLGVHSKTDAVIAAIRFGKATPPGLASPDRDALETAGDGGLEHVV
jgi:two-component system nitrate/nitrite response regulator NarL